MTHVVLITNGTRHDLHMQTIRSMGRDMQAIQVWNEPIVGKARNRGAASFEKDGFKIVRDQDYLYFTDDDVFFLPGWPERMIEALEATGCSVLGGCQHPYHGTNRQHRAGNVVVNEVDAVAGYSMLMRWETFDKYGPFDETQPGVAKGEDNAFCERVKAGGGWVGYIDPPAVLHVGLTNSEGKPATGHEQICAMLVPYKKQYPEMIIR